MSVLFPARPIKKDFHRISAPLHLLLQHRRNPLCLPLSRNRIREDQHLLALHAATPKLPPARQLNSCSKCWHAAHLLNKISPALQQGGPCWTFVPTSSAWESATCGRSTTPPIPRRTWRMRSIFPARGSSNRSSSRPTASSSFAPCPLPITSISSNSAMSCAPTT